jgi:acetylornithine/succinyldiaminopimelate/putrescine aminotransferase
VDVKLKDMKMHALQAPFNSVMATNDLSAIIFSMQWQGLGIWDKNCKRFIRFCTSITAKTLSNCQSALVNLITEQVTKKSMQA